MSCHQLLRSLHIPQTARTAMDFRPEVELIKKDYNVCVLPCIDECSHIICEMISFFFFLQGILFTYYCINFVNLDIRISMILYVLNYLRILFYMPRNHFCYFHYTDSFRTPLKIWDEILTPKLILGRERCNGGQILRFEIRIETDQEIANGIKHHVSIV